MQSLIKPRWSPDKRDRTDTKSPPSERRPSPRILIVTPEISYLPPGMRKGGEGFSAKAGGLADAIASLVSSFDRRKIDVHVALPNYRRLFRMEGPTSSWTFHPSERIHLAEDRAFYYREKVYGSGDGSDLRAALAFQREVLNNIVPAVKPDLIHCNDWMTGLIPAMAKRLGIPCVFTMHNIHSQEVSLEMLEERGIDAASFWHNLYYDRYPSSYWECRSHNAVDLLASGLFSSDFFNTVSPTFLNEVAEGRHCFVPERIRSEVAAKRVCGRAAGILNSPDPSYNPVIDTALPYNYGATDAHTGKRSNKREFQRRVGLRENPDAPLFFWPSRLDPVQKGPQLLSEILPTLLWDYREEELQIAFVADGPYQSIFREKIDHYQLHQRVAVCDFEEALSRHGFAASDFALVPSSFEPCGLAQMVALMYGALPIVHATGGLRDTVRPFNSTGDQGNGFAFEHHDGCGLRWAIDQAMSFFHQPKEFTGGCVSRVMKEANTKFSYEITASGYSRLYERALASKAA